MKPERLIKHNIKAHSGAKATRYAKNHGEIFSDNEQARLREQLEYVADQIRCRSSENRIALDLGCGTGNLTRHMLDLGFSVIAADVSPKFLRMVSETYAHTDRLQTLRLSGQDMAEIESGTVDLAAAYSVLHHIPDYLGAIKEMARVLKPGGIIYLDHELCAGYWPKSNDYNEFCKKARSFRRKSWTRFLRVDRNVGRLFRKIRRRINPRYEPDGDIHVFPDDHIEWEKINGLIASLGCEVLRSEDYLVYRQHYPPHLYDEYKDRCTDMCMFIARRIRADD